MLKRSTPIGLLLLIVVSYSTLNSRISKLEHYNKLNDNMYVEATTNIDSVNITAEIKIEHHQLEGAKIYMTEIKKVK